MLSYLSFVVLALTVSCLSLLSFFIYLFTPPRHFPKNIPTIPFYYALLPLFRDTDQAESYRQYLKEPLEKYGAVKIFFGGRWNILVRKPSYIAQVFKYEDTFAKSGNQVKIPYSLLAEYTGENIISGHGENWKLYTSIIKPALQAEQDPALVWRNSKLLKEMFISGSKSTTDDVPIYGPLHRYALANLSEVLYGSDFETLRRTDAPLHMLQTMIKPNIFNPIFLNFPFLDHLRLRSRQLGRKLVQRFRNTLRAEVSKGHNHVCDHNSQNLGCRLLGAHRQGLIDEKQLNDNLVSTFLAGHENPQLALMSLMYLLGANPQVQEKVREEVNTLLSDSTDGDKKPSYGSIHDLPYLTSVIYESLRMFPPISQLINRRTNAPVMLGSSIAIPEGTYLGYNAYSTNRDTEFWGPDADEFRPSRWGSTMEEINQLYRRANAKGAFISFHGGRRTCLGQKFAMLELRITMVELLKGLKWRVSESWDGKMTPAGPLYPRNLKLKFETTGCDGHVKA
ncbi:Dit2 protein [Aaosphaeria arxii CBS 175.79]|uniref:Dit2 protein n=1 Tax=Aaosphaeria arxii CBS 175.79 TaxID=1450172 RepID=A0A6A5X6D9_9PLEO|nr:Dit2 protein [Aaosphaeria arxii CBS 175.79]KAF2008482.1 Dit2 protein [Aaosphaeria arxii CBS 175.79]